MVRDLQAKHVLLSFPLESRNKRAGRSVIVGAPVTWMRPRAL
jgi:hypothetical protein